MGLYKFGVQLKPRKKERKPEDICSPSLTIFFVCPCKELCYVVFLFLQGKKKINFLFLLDFLESWGLNISSTKVEDARNCAVVGLLCCYCCGSLAVVVDMAQKGLDLGQRLVTRVTLLLEIELSARLPFSVRLR